MKNIRRHFDSLDKNQKKSLENENLSLRKADSLNSLIRFSL